MKKILFVCHGNICRSPMAEIISRDLIEKAGRQKDILVDSAATSTEELGNPVYPPAKTELAKHGLSCAGKHARQVKPMDYVLYDKLIVMDDYNKVNLLRLLGNRDSENKITRLLDYTDTPGEIEDPWYTGNYSRVYQQIRKACVALIETL